MGHDIPAALLAILTATTALGQDGTAPVVNPLAKVLDRMGASACENADLTCVTLTVPRDHFANDQSETLDITFGVSLATEPSKGTIIYVVGGPGYSGLAVADDYLSVYDPDFIARMDIVFFDQRGIGPVHGFSCPVAQMVFDLSDPSLAGPDAAKKIAETYVTDCLGEFTNADLAPFVDTRQAIRDIENFREAIGGEKVWIYGESYGTQFAQQYATAFPASVKGVILDGVVDLNLSVSGFYGSYTVASEAILTRVLNGCADIPACADDMQGDAAEAFDALAARLAAGPVQVDLFRADGTAFSLPLTAAALQSNAFGALYGTYGRAEFLRALAAANRGDLIPMLRLTWYNLGIDPETGVALPDDSWSSASYFTINCLDYTEPGTDAEARAAGILADAAAFAPKAPRLPNMFWVERVVCAYWPHQGTLDRPEQFSGGDYPTIVMNADADPITPISQSYAVFDNLRNGYLITMQGGPHVIWGRGLACPDVIVDDLIIDGVLPAATEQVCAQPLIDGYEPLTLTDPADAADPLVLVQSLATELLLSNALYVWDGEGDLTVGCDHGGSATIGLGIDDATAYTFAGCEWWPGIVIDGTGLDVFNDAVGDGLALEVSVSGDHSGQIVYHRDAITESWVINGTYDGAAIATRHP